jgi:hypothetical protein
MSGGQGDPVWIIRHGLAILAISGCWRATQSYTPTWAPLSIRLRAELSTPGQQAGLGQPSGRLDKAFAMTGADGGLSS